MKGILIPVKADKTMTNNNRSNRKYLIEEKENLIAKIFPSENITPGKLADETGISKLTLASKGFNGHNHL